MSKNGADPDICYVLPNAQGGVCSFTRDLIQYRSEGRGTHGSILTSGNLHDPLRIQGPMGGAYQIEFNYTYPPDNLRSIMKRLAATIPNRPGVLVCNDWIEMGMLSCHDPGRMVVQVLHGDLEFYYKLAVKHQAVVDRFICVSNLIAAQLRSLIPDRADDILYLPIGIPVTPLDPPTAGVPLRLIFVGRFHEDKGIFDIPIIRDGLLELGVEADWILVGDGPAFPEIKRRFSSEHNVVLTGNIPRVEVQQLYESSDILVFPTRAEGFSLVLLEAMERGVVPVVTDLPSGVPEVVIPGKTGFRVGMGHIDGFVQAVAELDRNRSLLLAMKYGARHRVEQNFDISRCITEYYAVFDQWDSARRQRPVRIPLHFGTRLDRKWLPNGMVRLIRKVVN